MQIVKISLTDTASQFHQSLICLIHNLEKDCLLVQLLHLLDISVIVVIIVS